MVHVEVKGQLCSIAFFFPLLCGFWGLNPGGQDLHSKYLYLLSHLASPYLVLFVCLFLHMCTCRGLHAWIYVSVHAHVCACSGHDLILGIFLHRYVPYLRREVRSMSLELSDQARLAGPELARSC